MQFLRPPISRLIKQGANTQLPRTCIICGGQTGSREHIFPAALGGRRTNKGIYCGSHNNAYAKLAGIIAEQLALFNALLGVVGDHADTSTSVTMTDLASGQEIEFNSERLRFKSPQVRSKKIQGAQTVMQMAFNTKKEAEAWVAEQKVGGADIQIVGEMRESLYHVGTAHKQITLGGNEEGLRSIGYIAQTFLAHSFPQIARRPELQAIKNYTLENVGTGFVWWDFEPAADLPPNSFPFGHRVIVGMNSEDATAYARISFFSTLNFAILFGNVPVEASVAVITDIDPLAKFPPNDVLTHSTDVALGFVSRPKNLSAGLSEAIHSGRAQAQIQELMRRTSDFERDVTAGKIMDQITGAGELPDAERDALFSSIVSAEAQRVLRLMVFVASDVKQRATTLLEREMADFMELAVKLDSTAENGLGAAATRSLKISCDALANQMSKDCKLGTLDQERISPDNARQVGGCSLSF